MFDFSTSAHLMLALAEGSAEPVRRAFERQIEPDAGKIRVTFLRNLEDANLQWLEAEDRQRVFDALAPEEEMRIHDRGIRRRLAPMLGGDLARLKLAFSLLSSLPGTPMLACGDEIGMG